MADDELTVVRADGNVKTLRSRDVGSQVQSQKVDVGPWLPTLVASSVYNATVTTSIYTLTTPSTATHVLLSIDSGDVRMTDDGGNPTATNGLILKDGFFGELAIPAGQNLKFYRAGASDGRLNASFRKYV